MKNKLEIGHYCEVVQDTSAHGFPIGSFVCITDVIMPSREYYKAIDEHNQVRKINGEDLRKVREHITSGSVVIIHISDSFPVNTIGTVTGRLDEQRYKITIKSGETRPVHRSYFECVPTALFNKSLPIEVKVIKNRTGHLANPGETVIVNKLRARCSGRLRWDISRSDMSGTGWYAEEDELDFDYKSESSTRLFPCKAKVVKNTSHFRAKLGEIVTVTSVKDAGYRFVEDGSTIIWYADKNNLDLDYAEADSKKTSDLIDDLFPEDDVSPEADTPAQIYVWRDVVESDHITSPSKGSMVYGVDNCCEEVSLDEDLPIYNLAGVIVLGTEPEGDTYMDFKRPERFDL